MDRNKFFQLGFNLSILLIVCSLLVLVLVWQKIPPEVPLFYSFPWGEKQLANPLLFGLLPAGSIIVFIVNLFVRNIVKENVLLSFLLIWTSTIFSLLSTYTLLKIVLLII